MYVPSLTSFTPAFDSDTVVEQRSDVAIAYSQKLYDWVVEGVRPCVDHAIEGSIGFTLSIEDGSDDLEPIAE
jgi:hypothetical protein